MRPLAILSLAGALLLGMTPAHGVAEVPPIDEYVPTFTRADLFLHRNTLAPAATAQAQPPIDCGPGDGRERLTTEGFQHIFESPGIGLTNTVHDNDPTGMTGAHRTARFPFTADFTPHDGGSASITLTWEDSSHDYGIFVYDDEGKELGRSENSSQADPTREEVVVDLDHCMGFWIHVDNLVGGPAQELTMDIEVTSSAQLLACGENDPAPGCAGKAAGEAPDLVPDTRVRLYFGGDRPGMVAATARLATSLIGQPSPLRQTMTPSRPTSGVANAHFRPFIGNPDYGENNSFYPYFRLNLDKPVTLSGPIKVLAWISSQTMGPTDELWFDLHVDGLQFSRTKVFFQPGPEPRPVVVTIEIDDTEAIEALESITLGITSPLPDARLQFAEWTLYYDSVQYQSRVTLPFALPA